MISKLFEKIREDPENTDSKKMNNNNNGNNVTLYTKALAEQWYSAALVNPDLIKRIAIESFSFW